MSQMNHLKKKWFRTRRKLTKVNRNLNLSCTLYVRTGQRVFLTTALDCARNRSVLIRHLRSAKHPFSIRRILPEYRRLDFSSILDAQFRDMYRFSKTLCVKFRNYLIRFRGFGLIVRVRKGQSHLYWTFSLEEAILLYLRRNALPTRLIEVAKESGRTLAEVSLCTLFMMDEINRIAKEFLDGRPAQWWDEETARYCADLHNDFNVPLWDIVLNIDASHQLICNPWRAEIQELWYSGYVRHCSNKILMAVSPLGLFVIVTPVAQGRRHDMAVAIRHFFYPKLRRKCIFPQFAGKTLGDSAFTRAIPVFPLYRPSNTDRKKRWNKEMAKVRISAEWAFKIVKGLWPSNKYVPRQKILQGQGRQGGPGHGNIPGKNLYNSFWLTNLHSCYERGNLISDYFGAKVPSLEEYLGVPPNSLD